MYGKIHGCFNRIWSIIIYVIVVIVLMSNIDKNELLEFIISNKPKAVVKYMRPSDLIFEEQVNKL